mmetsp:Transcript_8452/g.14269  ORF Transcript_8452/g.14269 Transcript_8452/m.14269 type:complete len:82 (+) Transcript_8452:2-247(+)
MASPQTQEEIHAAFVKSYGLDQPFPECPACQSVEHVVRVVVGRPTKQLAEFASLQPKLKLGGCIAGDYSTPFYCDKCEKAV